jgi:hypothetical protein
MGCTRHQDARGAFQNSHPFARVVDVMGHFRAGRICRHSGAEARGAKHMYELPFGRGKHFATNAGGLVNALAGGWQLGAVSTIQSGLAFTGDGRGRRAVESDLHVATDPNGLEVHFLNESQEPCAKAMMNIAIIRTPIPAHMSFFARATE